ncbi:kelch repeat and BTB domain-containing protein 8-like isoform X2 [Branchiostoma floridae x Branchiostoma japonicum]
MDARNHQQSDQVLRELNAMRGRAELTDVVLEVEGRSFPCHRAVLAACSPYFRGMFTSSYAEAKQERVSIQDVSEVAMATILNYAYTGFFHAEPDQVQAVMSAAKLLQIEFVSRKVAKYMKDHLDVSNCADVLMYADMLGDLTLKEASVRYITNRFNQVALQPSFLQLPLPLLQSLLNMDDLMVDSEGVVVQAALRWVDFNQEERMQHLPALCKSFRHCFISSDQLVELESKCLPTDCKLVYSDSTTQRVWQTRTEMPIILGDFAFISSKKRIAVCCDPLKGKLYEMRMPDHLQSYSVAVTPTDDLYMAGYIDRGSRKKGMKKFLQFNHQENTWESRCDLTTPRDSFPCHRNVLASCSPYFRGMFTSGYVEAKQEKITIKEVSKVAMATILDYAYTGSLKMEPDQVQDVMSAAGLLQVEFVGRQAAEYMKNHLDVSNCADVLIYADMLGDLSLQETSRNFIASRFNQVALQPSFLQLPLSHLQSLLNREDLMTSSEDNIVQAALRWVDFNQEERLQCLPALCRCFRRSFISSDQFVELKRRCPSKDCKLVYSDKSTKRLGQTQTEMTIILGADFFSFRSGRERNALCYDPLSGKLHVMNMPDNLSSYTMAVTPTDDLYLAGDILGAKEKSFFQFNHRKNDWESRCDLTTPRVSCGLVHLKGYIYAIGGDKTNQAAERYDPGSDEWTSIPSIPYPMPVPPTLHPDPDWSTVLRAVALDDSIYVITSKGCYCFSTTENKWSKTADMVKPPRHPQTVAFQGSIYCVDRRGRSPNYVQVYNPKDNVWKHSGNATDTDFPGDDLILMPHGGSLYLLTLHKKGKKDVVNGYGQTVERFSEIDLFHYQPEMDSWLKPGSTDMKLKSMVRWLQSALKKELQVARLVPKFLGYLGNADGDEDEDEDYEEDEEDMFDHFFGYDEEDMWVTDEDSYDDDDYDDEDEEDN